MKSGHVFDNSTGRALAGDGSSALYGAAADRAGLTDAARRLASVAMSAARWEWVFDERDKGLLASDLAGLIHQLAPLARVSEDMNGICKLHEVWHTTRQSDVYLAELRA